MCRRRYALAVLFYILPFAHARELYYIMYPAYQDTFFWFGDSMIANGCFNCADPNVGLSLNEDRTAIKCYMGDTGLLVSHAFDENELAEEELYKQILHDRFSINEGMLFENAIAQCLVASGHKLLFYTHYDETKHRNDGFAGSVFEEISSAYRQGVYRPYEKSCGKRRDRLHSRLYGDPSLIIEPWQNQYKK